MLSRHTHAQASAPLDTKQIEPIDAGHALVRDGAIRPEHAIPHITTDAEVVEPKALAVVHVMNRLAEPETALRVLVLQLMRIGGERGERKATQRKAQAGLMRMAKTSHENRPRAPRVSPKFPKKTLTGSTLVMLDVLGSFEPSVHEAVPPILRQRPDHECQEEGTQVHPHARSVTPRSRSRQSKVSDRCST